MHTADRQTPNRNAPRSPPIVPTPPAASSCGSRSTHCRASRRSLRSSPTPAGSLRPRRLARLRARCFLAPPRRFRRRGRGGGLLRGALPRSRTALRGLGPRSGGLLWAPPGRGRGIRLRRGGLPEVGRASRGAGSETGFELDEELAQIVLEDVHRERLIDRAQLDAFAVVGQVLDLEQDAVGAAQAVETGGLVAFGETLVSFEESHFRGNALGHRDDAREG